MRPKKPANADVTAQSASAASAMSDAMLNSAAANMKPAKPTLKYHCYGAEGGLYQAMHISARTVAVL